MLDHGCAFSNRLQLRLPSLLLRPDPPFMVKSCSADRYSRMRQSHVEARLRWVERGCHLRLVEHQGEGDNTKEAGQVETVAVYVL
jgi:hypothetical protein